MRPYIQLPYCFLDFLLDHFPPTHLRCGVQLLLDLLTEVKAHGGLKRVRKLLDHRFRTLVDSYRDKIQRKDFGGRIQDTSKILEENGYLSEAKQMSGKKWELKLYNCPISKVAKEYPHVCGCEQSSLGLLLHAKVTRDHHILSGQNYCSYVIEKK